MNIEANTQRKVLEEAHLSGGMTWACAAVVNWTFYGDLVSVDSVTEGVSQMGLSERMKPKQYPILTPSKIFRLFARGASHAYMLPRGDVEKIPCELKLVHLKKPDRDKFEQGPKIQWRCYSVVSTRADGTAVTVGQWSIETFSGEMRRNYAEYDVEEEDLDAFDEMFATFEADVQSKAGLLDGTGFNQVLSDIFRHFGALNWFGGTCLMLPNPGRGEEPGLEDEIMQIQRICEIVRFMWGDRVHIDLSYVYDDRTVSSGRWPVASMQARQGFSEQMLVALAAVERVCKQASSPSSNVLAPLKRKIQSLETSCLLWSRSLDDDWFESARTALKSARDLLDVRAQSPGPLPFPQQLLGGAEPHKDLT